MSRLGLSIQNKYGLKSAPSKIAISRWAKQTQRLIREGVDPEIAGRKAAERLFQIDVTRIVESEADTIDVLLKRAKEK